MNDKRADTLAKENVKLADQNQQIVNAIESIKSSKDKMTRVATSLQLRECTDLSNSNATSLIKDLGRCEALGVLNGLQDEMSALGSEMTARVDLLFKKYEDASCLKQ